ncbi:MAG TPA: SDR family NAD(P)-dependent oxidoreductase [Methylococcus sp.]|nr:SDR family NAD(P)-dependent oxidoreductase [Methylococcus sp.]
MTGRLAGKNAVITGGGAGIGLATARLFGREGARVSILDCNGERAETAAAGLREEGIDAAAFCADVANARGVAEAFGKIIDRHAGTIHVLVNNAGIAEFAGVEEATLDSWERIMAVNVTGTFLCSQAVLPVMKRTGGAIVNIASVAGLIGIPRMAAYCASKAAVIGLTRQMAADCTGLGIRVNCLCPGRVAGTELDRWIMGRDSDAATRAKMAKYPIGRFGQPEEIAQAALFLASDEASFVSGAVLTIDGGMTVL